MGSLDPNKLIGLPTELFMQITGYLSTDDHWSLALSVPKIPRFMVPVLRHLHLCVFQTAEDGWRNDTTFILAFLYKFPVYADQIYHIAVDLHTEPPKSDPTTMRLDYLISEWDRIPWLANWSKNYHDMVRRSSAHTSGIPDELSSRWSSLRHPSVFDEVELIQDTDVVLWDLAIILAQGTRICKMDLAFMCEKLKPMSIDMGHIGMLCLEPAFRCFRKRGQGLEQFNISTPVRDQRYSRCGDRRIATLLSAAFVLPRIRHLKLTRLFDTYKHNGDWSLYTGVVVDKITIEDCRLQRRLLPRLLHAVNGLHELEGHVLPYSGFGNHILTNHGKPRDIKAGLFIHRQTLQSLYIHRIPGDMSAFTKLKSLIVATESAYHLGGNKPLCQLLPQSLHSLASNLRKPASLAWIFELEALASDIKTGNTFPHLVHISRRDLFANRLSNSQEALEQDRRMTQALRSVGIDYCHVPKRVGDFIRDENCTGACGKQRKDDITP